MLSAVLWDIPNEFAAWTLGLSTSVRILTEVPLRNVLADTDGELSKQGEVGRGRLSDTKSIKAEDSDNRYIMRRLKRDQPELFKSVKAGEVSPNEAAISTNWRTLL